MKTKTCIDCKKRKSVDAFYRIFKDAEHRQSRCKPCDNRKRTGGYKRNGDGTRRTVVERLADGSLVMTKVERAARSGPVER